MTTLLVSEFKAKCLGILDRVHSTGETVLVTRRGKPLVRVGPAEAHRTGLRQLRGLAGEASVKGDIVHTNLSHDWENLK